MRYKGVTQPGMHKEQMFATKKSKTENSKRLN